MTKQPSYRFAGYNEPWEDSKLGECTKISAGGDIEKSKLLNNGKYPVIANALTNDGIVGYYNDSYRIDAPAVTVTGRGDIGVAKARNVNFTPVVRLLSLKSEHDVIFLENAINIQNIVIESTGVPQLTAPQLGRYRISFPTLPEQTAIGSFFQDIDQLISLQQRKLEVLKEQKKTYLKLLFPAKGQTRPALRFAGFEDEWTSVLLGDISELYQPKTISSEELLTEGFPVFGANGYIGYYKDYNHKEDQVTISARGEGTGTPSFVEGPVWITGNSMVVNVEKQANIIKPFLYAFCLSFNFKPFVTGGAQPQLTREVLKKVNIMLPSLPEQEAIGSFFQDLDKSIAKQEEKVNQLKESKQTLLRKMFI